MAYHLSDTDRKNISSFQHDDSRRSLKSIDLVEGSIRALTGFEISFKYPLAAISGRNGSGKSTVLALAACAYHGSSGSWRLPSRSLPYYRFSDFFVQAQGEVPVDGVRIRYGIHHNKWKPADHLPDGKGVGYQERWKGKDGKWNEYSSRIHRPVAFFGIDRVVPPSEKGGFVSQRRYFITPNKKSEIEDRTRESVSRVLGLNYEDLELRGSGSYKLLLVRLKGSLYSGFNMGAGEQALFNLFLAIHSAPRASLFVIDEIELGLHEAAQSQLVHELKSVALSSAHQFIFTTHSPTVLEGLPPEGRFFLDRTAASSTVAEGVSPSFAAGRLSGKPSSELVIYVEDVNALRLVNSSLSLEKRKRTRLCEVGSNSAVINQMAGRFVDGDPGVDVMCVLDGDQRAARAAHVDRFLGLVPQKARVAAKKWINARLAFLPSDMPPERFVFSKMRIDHLEAFAERFGLEQLEAQDILDKALLMGEHSELYWVSEEVLFEQGQVWSDACAIL